MDSTEADLVRQRSDAANAWLRGDMDTYLALTVHTHGFTLTRPDGGAPEQFEDRGATFDDWQSPFTDGESTLEVTAVHRFDDIAVLVLIERQHGRVGGRADQDLSLRVTEVMRRTEGGWELVHRHADPLVRPLTPGQLMDLMRG